MGSSVKDLSVVPDCLLTPEEFEEKNRQKKYNLDMFQSADVNCVSYKWTVQASAPVQDAVYGSPRVGTPTAARSIPVAANYIRDGRDFYEH